MVADPLLHHILSDERLTRGLGDEEARVLIEWLVEQAEELMTLENQEEAAAAVSLAVPSRSSDRALRPSVVSGRRDRRGRTIGGRRTLRLAAARSRASIPVT